jgi:hypothetical protein
MEENVALPDDKKAKFDLVEPRMDPALDAFGGGGVSNLLKHCNKKHIDQKGNPQGSGKVFANLILNSFELPDPNTCENQNEYHRKFLMNFLKNSAISKTVAWKACSAGSWMKSFPKSASKFFEFVFAQMRPHVLAEIKRLIKQTSN